MYFEQIRIVKEVLHSCKHSADVKQLVKGVMIESYIEPGNQKVGEGVYGKSITDACLGWEESERLLYLYKNLHKIFTSSLFYKRKQKLYGFSVKIPIQLF